MNNYPTYSIKSSRTGFPCVHVKSLQSFLTLCDPLDCGLLGPSVHRILQARILEWVAIPSFKDLPPQGSHPGLCSALAGRFFTLAPPGEPCVFYLHQNLIFWKFSKFWNVCHQDTVNCSGDTPWLIWSCTSKIYFWPIVVVQ